MTDNSTAEFDPRLIPTVGRALGAVGMILCSIALQVVVASACVGGLLYLCHVLLGWPS
jgi:hypothetical protein